MTLPTIITKYEKNVTAERLKKFYSTIQNAANLSVYENGEMADWEFPQRNHDPDVSIFFRKYYLPYLKKSEECVSSECFVPQKYKITKLDGRDSGGIYVVNYFVKLADGAYIYFLPNVQSGYFWMYVDLNGHQKPNRIGRDIFVFDIYSYPYRGLTNRKNYKIKFWGNELNTASLTRAGDYSCSKTPSDFSGFNCGELILRNNWTIPDNYPW